MSQGPVGLKQKISHLCHGDLEEERERVWMKKEIMAENFPNLESDISLQIQEAEKTPNRIHPKKFTSRHIVNS